MIEKLFYAKNTNYVEDCFHDSDLDHNAYCVEKVVENWLKSTCSKTITLHRPEMSNLRLDTRFVCNFMLFRNNYWSYYLLYKNAKMQ